MPTNMEIQTALADLEAGKFSFRMVDAIKDHVATLESELKQVSDQHASAVKDIYRLEYTVSRLESELRKVNARVHALVKANALTETALRETRNGAVMIRDYLPIAREHAITLSKKTLAWLSTVDLKAEFEKLKALPLTQKALAFLANLDLQAEWSKLKAHPQVEKILRDLQPALDKAKAYLPVAQKQVSAAVDKATAYIAELQKKTA